MEWGEPSVAQIAKPNRMAATVNLKIKIRLHGYTPIRFAKAKLALTEIFPKILADSKTPNSRGVDNVSSLSGTGQSLGVKRKTYSLG